MMPIGGKAPIGFFSEKEFIAIKDEKALGNSSRYRETVKQRAKNKILVALNALMEIENPRIVNDRILVRTLDVAAHFLKLRGFDDEAKVVGQLKDEIVAAIGAMHAGVGEQ